LVEEGNPNLEGDALTAALLSEAAVRAAAALASINLSTAKVDDGRIGRANRLVDTTAAIVGRAVER
jgi:formiminotetrahydrofolate cyclodeaminase